MADYRNGHREKAPRALGSQAGVCPSPGQEAPASLYSSYASRWPARHAISPWALINPILLPSLHQKAAGLSIPEGTYSLQSSSGFPGMQVKCMSFGYSRPSTTLPYLFLLPPPPHSLHPNYMLPLWASWPSPTGSFQGPLLTIH